MGKAVIISTPIHRKWFVLGPEVAISGPFASFNEARDHANDLVRAASVASSVMQDLAEVDDA